MAEHGYLSFVLHAHLPYVLGHGTWPHGEEWLWEAAAETYVPLANTLRTLSEEGIGGAVTLGITPVLAEMLADPRFRRGFPKYLEQKIEAADANAAEFSSSDSNRELRPLAEWWSRHFEQIRESYEKDHGGDLIATFRQLRDEGVVELLGGPASHCYTPLLPSDGAIHLQYDTGQRVHRRLFGKAPVGAWLPECAYRAGGTFVDGLGRPQGTREGVEQLVSQHGIEFGFVDSHMIRGGHLAWSYGDRFRERTLVGQLPDAARREDRSLYRPHWVGDGSAAFSIFARDPRTGMQVWSGEYGYPGAGCYLEFHKRHDPGGHRYWQVTDPTADLADKERYRPEGIEARIEHQARHFVELVESVVRSQPEDVPPLIVSPYDAELFGHWWFEGPRWLAATLRLLKQSKVVEPVTPSYYSELHPPTDRMILPDGSWGDRGDHRTWSGPHARDFWMAAEWGEEALRKFLRVPPAHPLEDRVRRQAARTLLLLQASDWPFLIYSGTATDYAEARIAGHARDLSFLLELREQCSRGVEVDKEALAHFETLEARDRVFPQLDPGLLLSG